MWRTTVLLTFLVNCETSLCDLDGNLYWYKDGRLHREDGPAVIRSDGAELWYKEGLLHRENGPALIYKNSNCVWYQYGKYHREDGPAIEWWMNGIEYTEEEFNQWLEKKNLNKRLNQTLDEKPSFKKLKI